MASATGGGPEEVDSRVYQETLGGLALGVKEVECARLAFQALTGDRKAGVKTLEEFLAVEGWKLTTKDLTFRPDQTNWVSNRGKFSRDPDDKWILVRIVHAEEDPTYVDREEVIIDEIVHEFLLGRLYFDGQEIIRVRGKLSDEEYEAFRQRILAIDKVENMLKPYYKSPMYEYTKRSSKDRSDYSPEKWKKTINNFVTPRR